MGAWNVLSRREDDHLSLLSSELKHLNIGIAALSEGFGDWIVVRSWWVVTPTIGLVTLMVTMPRELLAVSNNLTSMIIEVTPVNERIMRLRIRHSLGVISLVSVYAPTKASDLTMKDAFYATLESVVDQCPR